MLLFILRNYKQTFTKLGHLNSTHFTHTISIILSFGYNADFFNSQLCFKLIELSGAKLFTGNNIYGLIEFTLANLLPAPICSSEVLLQLIRPQLKAILKMLIKLVDTLTCTLTLQSDQHGRY